jgi:uncharacterized membrane protein
MSWVQRKRLRALLRSSLWVIPVLAMFLAMICAPLSRRLDHTLRLPFLAFGPEGARAAVGLMAASLLTFVVFFFSVLLLTVQIASGNLSPRIIARPFRSIPTKLSLGLFVFTFVYGVSVLGRLEEQVLQLPVFLTVLLTIASLGTFLFVVEYISKELRPVTILTSVASEGLSVIQAIYPLPLAAVIDAPNIGNFHKQNNFRSVRYQGRPGVVIAFDVRGLVKFAERKSCAIELVPQVGDFVASGAQLFRVYGGGMKIPDGELRNSIDLGAERTMEQDPAFAFRIIVDIAAKALSPAINDPTTGVLAIDQLQILLQEVGRRDLNTGTVRDAKGDIRFAYRTPDWKDFVLLAVSEIRHYGANSVQIMRRLRAMLEDLISVLPAERAPLLQQQLDLLHFSIEREFKDRPDREQAEIPDSQGLGGRLASISNPDGR